MKIDLNHRGPRASASDELRKEVPNPLKYGNVFPIEAKGSIVGQTSRIVTVIDGVEVMEVTTHDLEGDPVETGYFVQGEKYQTLREARGAATRIAEF